MDDDDVEFEPENIVVGPFLFSLMTVSFMPLEKLLENQSKGVEISGQKVWCGSLVVAEFLINNSDYVSGKVIVELGSGTGLLGMLCKKLGSSHVFLTDHDERSLAHMRGDIATNEIDDTSVHRVDWFQANHREELISLIQEYCSSSAVRIVAGDVLYKNVLLEPFFQTVLEIFKKATEFGCVDCRMLLCHVPRAGVDQVDVTSKATEVGLQIVAVDAIHWKKGCVIEHSIPEDFDRAQLYEIYF